MQKSLIPIFYGDFILYRNMIYAKIYKHLYALTHTMDSPIRASSEVLVLEIVEEETEREDIF